MPKVWGVLGSFAIVAGTLFGSAAPALASCETELGDMCRAYGVICRSAHDQVPVLDKVHECPTW
jgi:hypothetical protein